MTAPCWIQSSLGFEEIFLQDLFELQLRTIFLPEKNWVFHARWLITIERDFHAIEEEGLFTFHVETFPKLKTSKDRLSFEI